MSVGAGGGGGVEPVVERTGADGATEFGEGLEFEGPGGANPPKPRLEAPGTRYCFATTTPRAAPGGSCSCGTFVIPRSCVGSYSRATPLVCVLPTGRKLSGESILRSPRSLKADGAPVVTPERPTGLRRRELKKAGALGVTATSRGPSARGPTVPGTIDTSPAPVCLVFGGVAAMLES